MSDTGHFRKGNFKLTLEVIDGVLRVSHEGELSYWDEIGLVEAHRALLRMKVLGDYRWPHQDEARVEQLKQQMAQADKAAEQNEKQES